MAHPQRSTIRFLQKRTTLTYQAALHVVVANLDSYRIRAKEEGMSVKAYIAEHVAPNYQEERDSGTNTE